LNAEDYRTINKALGLAERFEKIRLALVQRGGIAQSELGQQPKRMGRVAGLTLLAGNPGGSFKEKSGDNARSD
jgi:hypothetical protein